ncbi:hypothetical protein [Niabella beijingensis]|uniref:hypothetical protein n=1 Tax=Niabella beijingensis TaxID=2872700 RepID=UPI001CBF256A|nr:hypothetical protein [Niabella beijingensis]MBZ4192257.1 hypothetical protein [Niabella beijingensis]
MIGIKEIAVLLLILCNINSVAAQQVTGKNIIDVPEQMQEQQSAAFKKKLPVDGWILLRYKEGKQLLNLSNKDYILNLRLTCENNREQPGFLVEYSDAYRDGDWGGLDFISSAGDNDREVHFLLDGKDYKNPFAQAAKPGFGAFVDALKKAAKLTIAVYDSTLNPETGKNESLLNRAIDFKLGHAELLDIPVNCGY